MGEISLKLWTVFHRALADMNNDGKMDMHEFSIAMKLIKLKLQGHPLPPSLPPSMKQQPLSIPPQPPFGEHHHTDVLIECLKTLAFRFTYIYLHSFWHLQLLFLIWIWIEYLFLSLLTAGMPSMGAMPGLPAVPPMPLPPLPPGVPGVGVSPPLVSSVTPQVPSLANGTPAMIQPISGFSHSGRPKCSCFWPSTTAYMIGCLRVFLSVSQLPRSTKPLRSTVPASSYRRASL